MSEISVYDIVPTPKLADKLIGTSVGGVIPDVTYNFTLEELLQLFIPNLPANNLQGVLDYGNTATQNINLTGTINTTDLNVFATASILDSILSGETHITGELYDGLDSKGTAGQVLRSTGSGVEWYTVPTVIPTLQQVLTSGNTADKNIILTANITAVTATATNVVSNTSLAVNGILKDGTASAGGSNQILSSTGSGVQWVDMPVYNAVSPLLYDNPTKTFSIQVANSTEGGYLTSSDWITFDGKQDPILLTTTGTSGASTFIGNTLNIPIYTPDLSGYVPTSRTLTINGITYDLSANRSWTIPAGVAEVTATSPLFSTGGAYPDISIQVASTSQDGYLSATDWNTFNAKQGALTLTTTGTSGPSTLVGDTLNIPQYQPVLVNPITGLGTVNYVPKFNTTSSITNSNIQDSGTLITLGSNTNISSGGLGIGTTNLTGVTLGLGKNMSGTTSVVGISNTGVIQSAASIATYYATFATTQAATFTLATLNHYYANQGTIGAGSSVGSQYGFRVDASLIGATNNYGFRGAIPSGTNRWNIYMDGTALNYLAGNLLIGSTTDNGIKLQVTGQGYFSGAVGIGTTTLTGLSLAVVGLTRFTGTTASDTAPLGAELAAVTGTGTNWTLAGTDLNNGGYTHTVGSVVPLTTSLVAVSGTYYQIAYTITGRTAGSITIAYGGTSTSISATGITGPLASSTSVLTITPTTDFDGTVALSIKSIGTSSASIIFANSTGGIPLEIRASSVTSNTFIGTNAGRRVLSGIAANTFIGSNAGAQTTSGGNNTFIGNVAGQNTSTGSNNVFIGASAGQNNTVASSNVFIGSNSGSSNTTGSGNAFLGNAAGQLNSTGSNNANFGNSAGSTNTTGSGNTLFGNNAGRYIADGVTAATVLNQSILIGYNTRVLADSQINQIVIGYGTTGLGSNTTVLGNSSTTLTALYGAVITGGTSVNASAQLQIDSTTKGFLPPRMTAAQRIAIASPATGLIVFQTDGVEGLWLRVSTGWRELTVV